jgi:hypothetical protein
VGKHGFTINTQLFLLTLAIGFANAWLAVTRFGPVAGVNPISPSPRAAKRWTTAINYLSSMVIYIALCTIVFALLAAIPQLTLPFVDDIAKFIDSEKFSSFIKEAAEEIRAHPEYNWASPILALAVFVALFHFSRSPLAIVDQALRRGLQKVAAIPRKVRTILGLLRSEDFIIPTESKGAILESIPLDKVNCRFAWSKEAANNHTFRLFTEASLLDVIISHWTEPGSPQNEFYNDEKKWIDDLHNKYEEALESLDRYCQMSRSDPLAVDMRKAQLEHDLDELIQQQRIPVICAIVSSKIRAENRKKAVTNLGYRLTVRPSVRNVFRALREDLVAISLLLAFVVFPVCAAFAYFILEWRPHHSWAEYIFLWPILIVTFTLASVLPALAIKERRALKDESRTHPDWFSAGESGIAGAICAVLLLFFIKWTWSRYYSWEISWNGAWPFSILAFSLGAGTEIMLDISRAHWFGSVIGAFTLGIVSSVTAFAGELVLLNPSGLDFSNLPGPARFVLVISLGMGGLIGAVIPMGYRRYRMDLTPGGTPTDEIEVIAASEPVGVSPPRAEAPL